MVSMNHNLSFCQTGQKQEGKPLFQASMVYLETRKEHLDEREAIQKKKKKEISLHPNNV